MPKLLKNGSSQWGHILILRWGQLMSNHMNEIAKKILGGLIPGEERGFFIKTQQPCTCIMNLTFSQF